jgi:hypothetical protein
VHSISGAISLTKYIFFQKVLFVRPLAALTAENCLNLRANGIDFGTRIFVKMTAGTDCG